MEEEEGLLLPFTQALDCVSEQSVTWLVTNSANRTQTCTFFPADPQIRQFVVLIL